MVWLDEGQNTEVLVTDMARFGLDEDEEQSTEVVVTVTFVGK